MTLVSSVRNGILLFISLCSVKNLFVSFNLFFLLLLFPNLAYTSSNSCAEVFVSSFNEVTPDTSSMMDESGFIGLFGMGNRVSEEQTLLSELTMSSLKDLSDLGRESVKSYNWPVHIREQFRRFQGLSNEQLSNLNTSQKLAILEAFSRWNLKLSDDFLHRLLNSLNNLEIWRPHHFFKFSQFRKLSPQQVPVSFIEAYQQAVKNKFTQWNIVTQLEVLGAELFHNSGWDVLDLHRLFKVLEESLAGERKPATVKSLKEFYRGLLYLRALQPTFFFNPIVGVEGQLERHMQAQGLSLDHGGRSGSQSPPRGISPYFESLIARIDLAYPGEVKIYEATSSDQMGFFDPVDLYYPNLNLVVEWDGPLHYFRSLEETGELNPFDYDLRPMDRMKDEILNRMGIHVLRWARQHNDLFDHLNLETFQID